MAARAILVTGATGKQGSSVINALLRANANVEILALTRNAQSASAQSLVNKSKNIKLLTGDLNAISDVFHKAKETTKTPIWGVFAVTTFYGGKANTESEEAQGKALVDASLANGVSHFVFSSVERGGPERSATDSTNVPHFISKFNVEKHLFKEAKGKDMTWTVLRPVAFMDNLVPGFMGKYFNTIWETTLHKDQKLQLIATSDIGQFAAQAFLNSSSPEYKNTAISIAGDELTFIEWSKVFQEKTGKPVEKTFSIAVRALNLMVKEMAMMFAWFRDVGFGADIKENRKTHPGMKTFGEWLETESAWKKN